MCLQHWASLAHSVNTQAALSPFTAAWYVYRLVFACFSTSGFSDIIFPLRLSAPMVSISAIPAFCAVKKKRKQLPYETESH
jgi:hypothetical protein